MSNKVAITNNVTTHVVEVTPGGDSTTLVVSQQGAPHVVELNAGLFLATPVTNLEDLNNVNSGATNGQVIQYDGAVWAPTTLDLSSAGELTADIGITDGAGNLTPGQTLTAGTSFEDIFNTMLVSYQEPVLSVSGWTTGTFEHGATFSDTSFDVAFTNDANINTGDSGAYSTSDTYLTDVGGVVPAADGTVTTPSYNGALLVTNTNAGVSTTHRSGAAALTVNGFTNTEGGAINSVTQSSTVRFRYWVVDRAENLTQNPGSAAQLMLQNADSSLNGTGADVVESNLISSVSQLGFTAAGSHDFIYWILPAAFTVNNITQNTSINLYAGDTADQTTAVIHLGEFDLTNQHSQTVRMQVLRSKVSNAFAAGSVIAFS